MSHSTKEGDGPRMFWRDLSLPSVRVEANTRRRRKHPNDALCQEKTINADHGGHKPTKSIG